MQEILSFGCSRAAGSASDTSNDKVLLQQINPVARQSGFTESGCQKRTQEIVHCTEKPSTKRTVEFLEGWVRMKFEEGERRGGVEEGKGARDM